MQKKCHKSPRNCQNFDGNAICDFRRSIYELVARFVVFQVWI
jgi:hypothetical protein